MDWDLYWRMQLIRRRADPVDFRRWKRASQKALRELHPGEGVRVLDATAGLGDHTVNLAELGFEVEACDTSPVAREASAQALREAGLHGVPIHDLRWQDLGGALPGRFDLIFHDSLHWIEASDEMHEVLLGLRDALRPGGELVFFFADPRMAEPGDGAQVRQWDREGLPLHEHVWDAPDGDAHVTLVRANVDREGGIDQHHLYVRAHADGTRELSALIMRRVYRWDWHAIGEALRKAGFVEVVGDIFVNDGGHEFAMNRARR